MEVRPATALEVQAAMAGDANLPLLPLALDMVGCATEGEMNANFLATLERGYTPINGLLDRYMGKTASLVGSGPSIKETYKELKGDVFAVNSAIGFLLDHGVIPRFAMLWDAADIIEQFAVPHPEVTYLVGSRCHPKVFERLKGCDVVVWHAGGDHNIYEMMKSRTEIEEPLVNGGSAGITRGMYLVAALGYRDIHIFGGDSSYSNDGATHIRGSLVPEKDLMVAIGNAPPIWFRTTPEWCAQVNEYRSIYALFTHAGYAKLKVYGEGTMLKCMHDILEAKRLSMPSAQFMADIGANEKTRADLDAQASEMQLAQQKKSTQPLGATT